MEDHSGNFGDHRWLAYELHDGLLQWLVSARMNVDTTLSQVDADKDVLREKLTTTQNFLESALEEGRELIGFLETQESTAVDFSATLHAFVERIRFDVAEQEQEIVLRSDERPWPDLPQRSAWNLMRVVQQAVRNTIQHAGACTIHIDRGWHDPTTLLLQVSDSGRGFSGDPQPTRPGHFGLASMQHRVNLIGGRLHIRSAPGEGTTARIEIPAASL